MTYVSVALCTYNGAKYLNQQLESIAAQTRLPDEIVICDDRSSDKTAEVATAFGHRAPFPVRFYINDRTLGVTKNFERVIGLCQGDIIALSDQDDVWYPEKLARMEDVFTKQGSSLGAVFSDADLTDNNGQPSGARMWEYFSFGARLQERVDRGEAFDVLIRKHIVPGCTMAFRREYKDLILPFPSVGIHDRWMALVIAAVAKVDIIPQPLMRYRRHEGQQLGVALTSLSVAVREGRVAEQVTRARRPSRNVYDELAMLYQAAMTRLLEKDQYGAGEKKIEKLREKIAHLEVRASLPKSLLRRLPVVLAELGKLHYHRYSNGIYSLAQDMLFGN